MAKFDRRSSFQQLHNRDHPDFVPWQAPGMEADMDDIMKARHTGRLPAMAPFIPENDGDEEYRHETDLDGVASTSLRRYQSYGIPEDVPLEEAAGWNQQPMRQQRTPDHRRPFDDQFEFYSDSPAAGWEGGSRLMEPREDTDEDHGDEGGGSQDDGVVMMDLKSLNLPPVNMLKRLDSVAASEGDPCESGSPGLEVFGELPTPTMSRAGVHSMLSGHLMDLDVIYRMALRGVMLAWEEPTSSIVKRLQLADLLRVAFRIDRREHLEVMQWAMECNSHAASELSARLGLVKASDAAFLEEEARAKWEASEAQELRRLLRLQQALPPFNGLLELAVLEGNNLKPKKSPAIRIGSSSSPKHFAVLEVDPGDKAASKSAPVRTRNARGQSPRWNAKSSPQHLTKAPAGISVSVCLGGVFEDEAEEANILSRAVPLMSQVHADTISSIGQRTLGHGAVSLRKPDGTPEDAYLLPAARTVTLCKHSRGLFKIGGSKSSTDALSPPSDDGGSRGSSGKKIKEVGATKIVVRYVPETRVQLPPTEKGAASSSSSSSSPALHEAIVSGEEASSNYQVLLNHLWDCWENDVRLPTHQGHTYTIDQSAGGQTMATMVLSRDDRIKSEEPVRKSTNKSSTLRRALSEMMSGGSRLRGTLLLDDWEPDSDFIPRYLPGEPWTRILDAVGKLYRVRQPWHQLLLIGRLLKDWHLEPAYLTVLLHLWQPVVELAREGRLSKREAKLHVSCTKQIVHNCIKAVENYDTAFGRLVSTEESVEGIQLLLALTGLAIRYDTVVESLIEPLKIHIRRNVRRQMRKALPNGAMNHRESLMALSRAVGLAAGSLERDKELSEAFPDALDLPYFAARLRYKMISDRMLRMFTGPGVVAYDKLVMEIQDEMKELHHIMIDSNISLADQSNPKTGLGYVVLLDVDRVLGRSLLKWIRDIGLNVMDWMDKAVELDMKQGWTPASDAVAYSSSVVELFKMFAAIIDNVRDRMPEQAEMQTALHSEILERLQAAVHHVFRRYVRVLEGYCTDMIANVRAQRQQELQRVLSSQGWSGEDPAKASTAEESCITPQICALLNNIWALHDGRRGLDGIQDMLLQTVCGVSDLLDSDMDTGTLDMDEDAMSELSFMSEEEDPEEKLEPEAALRMAAGEGSAAEELVNPADNAEFFMSVKTADLSEEPKLDRVLSRVGSGGSMALMDTNRLMAHRRRAWQRHCSSNEAVLASAEANCNNRMAEAFKVKLLIGIVRLLQAERGRAQVLDTLVGANVANKKPAQLFSLQGLDWTSGGSSSRGQKGALAQEASVSMLKEINYQDFMEAILSKELGIMSEHMARNPHSFRHSLSTVWAALVSAMEDVVLGVSGLSGTVGFREAQTVGKLLDAAVLWFNCDGEGVSKKDLMAVTSRLQDLLELHLQPTASIAVRYNSTLAKMELKSSKHKPFKSATGGTHPLPIKKPRSHKDAPFVEWFHEEVKRGPGTIHLLFLMRQRASEEAAAAELLKKMLKHAEDNPVELVFGKHEEVVGRWPCLYTKNRAPGHLCVTHNHVAFCAVGSDPSGARDARVLLDLSLVSRMDLTFESYTQSLTFTMPDKTAHSFSGPGKTFGARGEIHKAVAGVVAGSGSTLERSLRGEGGTEAAVSLNLPSDEEIYHSMECARVRGGGLWCSRGVLYVCKSFVMFDRPGKERVKVGYAEVTGQKLAEGNAWLLSGSGVVGGGGDGGTSSLNLVLKTSNAAVGTLTFCNMTLGDVTLCMTSIASQVANVNEYETTKPSSSWTTRGSSRTPAS